MTYFFRTTYPPTHPSNWVGNSISGVVYTPPRFTKEAPPILGTAERLVTARNGIDSLGFASPGLRSISAVPNHFRPRRGARQAILCGPRPTFRVGPGKSPSPATTGDEQTFGRYSALSPHSNLPQPHSRGTHNADLSISPRGLCIRGHHERCPRLPTLSTGRTRRPDPRRPEGARRPDQPAPSAPRRVDRRHS
jgi:hypothetical protein